VVYYHEKQISFSEKMRFKMGKISHHEDIFLANPKNESKLSDKEYETYDDDKFRKLFY
jgi:hypothetical protein